MINFITLITSVVIAFIMMPFTIHTLGDRWYGLWAVIASILSLYSMIDLGISSASQRFLSHALPRQDHFKFKEYFNTSLALYSAISSIILVVTLVLYVFGAHFIDNAEDIDVFRIIIAIMGTTLAFSFPFYVINGVIVANMRYDLSAIVTLFKLVIRAVCVYIALSAGYGIIALAVITALTEIAANIVLTVFALKLTPWIEIGRKYVSKSCARELFSFSIYSFISSTSFKLRIDSAPLIISAVLSLSTVTIYTIAAQFMSYFHQAISSLLVVTLPLFTKNISLKDEDKSRYDFLFSTKLACLISSLGAAVIILLCTPFIATWMGPDYISAAIPTMILIAGTAIDSCQQPASQFFFAAKKNHHNAWINAVAAAVTIALSLQLAPAYGVAGVALAVILPLSIIKIFIQPFIICKLVKISAVSYYFIMVRQLAAFMITAYIFHDIATMEGYLDIVIYAVLITLFHSAMSFILVFNQHERSVLINFAMSWIMRTDKHLPQ